MLVIGREQNQTVIVGNNLLRVMLCNNKGRFTRIGFEAAEDLRVVRSELLEPAPFAPLSIDAITDRIMASLPASVLTSADATYTTRDAIRNELAAVFASPARKEHNRAA